MKDIGNATRAVAAAVLLAFSSGCSDDSENDTPLIIPTTIGEMPVDCGFVTAEPEAILSLPDVRAPVAVDGDVLIAGSRIFRRARAGWIPEAEIVLPEGQCCEAVALAGETAVVIASVEGAWGGGPVYVLERLDGTWTPTALSNSYWSRAVALSAQAVAVGCHGGNAASGCAEPFGTVGIYERIDDTWTETAQLQGDAEACLFGDSVALSEATLVVGEGTQAHMYERRGSEWVAGSTLETSGGQQAKVALSGPIAVLGRGPLHVFEKVGEHWPHAVDLSLSSPGRSASVSLEGGCVAAGSTPADGPGSVEVFERGNAGWRSAIVLGSGAEGDGFGASVSLSGRWLAVGGLDTARVYRIER